ncbi:hypothetical protein GGS26DRAFT_64925 [Hypomontagnella submonticulosa]|nr:hypothetical protein GGS26DRAFT_64925 [Hypomontagnella submonticulosa]
MQKRRSHKKSRNGCQNCKKWHTKCDESGPPCNNCALRKAKCVYNRPKAENFDNGTIALRSKEIERPRGDVGSLCGAYGGPGRLLELELMHQWSTSTYKSFCGIPEDGEYLQSVLPRAALNYDFMLNCLMSISSLQIARAIGGPESKKYVTAGLEFYNRGSSSFRTHLGNMNADNSHVLYMFSSIAIAVHLSIPQRSTSVLELAKVAFDLVNGSTSIGMMGMPWILNSNYPLRLYVSRIGATKDWIPPDVRVALEKLKEINEQRNKVASEPISGGDENGVVLMSKYELYEMAIQNLETCFAEEARGLLRGFGSAFPAMAGKHFTTLVNNSDPFALLIVMHWTIVIGMIDQSIWWLVSVAEPLAQEISDLLVAFHPDLAEEWAEGMAWVLNRHRSPPLTPQLRELPYVSG